MHGPELCGPYAQMAGLRLDVIEYTDWTAERLRAVGVPGVVVDTVAAVTNVHGAPYDEMIRAIAGKPRSALVKIPTTPTTARAVALAPR